MVGGLRCGQNVDVREDWHLLYLLNNCHERVAMRTNKGGAGTVEIEPHTRIIEKNPVQNERAQHTA